MNQITQNLKMRMQKFKCSISDQFRKYNPEKEKEIRKLGVKEDATLKKMKDAFDKYLIEVKQHMDDIDKEIEKMKLDPDDEQQGDPETRRFAEENGLAPDEVVPMYDENADIDDDYKLALKVISSNGLKYTPEDITNFSASLHEFEKVRRYEFYHSTGYFLSALINTCKGTEFTIMLENIKLEIDSLGYKNKKNITVRGNLGNEIAADMQRGEMVVKGDVGMCGHLMGGRVIIEGNGDDVGNGMTGGEIIVKGNATDSVGHDMMGGRIIVEGSAKDANIGSDMDAGKIIIKGDAGKVGSFMNNGEIRLEGNYKSIDKSMLGGNIYHKGKMIVRWGRKI